MDVLGRGELIKRMCAGDLVVAPILSEEQLGAASIDLRLDNVVLMVRARGSSHVDPAIWKAHARSGNTHEGEAYRQQKHEKFEIPFENTAPAASWRTRIGPNVRMVATTARSGRTITARSTWAREGLSIATANLIEPRYEGIATLELANMGQIPLALYPGLRLAQITFASVSGDTERARKAQFKMAFEPQQGAIAREDDFPFIPDRKP